MGRRRGTKLLLDKLLPQRRDSQQTQKVASALLEGNATHNSHRPLYMKGTHNGRFYRVKLNDPSTAKKPIHHLPHLPGDGEVPHAFKKVPRRSTGKAAREKTMGPTKEVSITERSGLSLPKFLKGGGDFSYEEAAAYMKAWWKENWSTVVLNFGSVCTLIGFTRSDVLELRCLSVTGSAANVIYHFTQRPFKPLPVAWSAVFAIVNSFKIREIVLERHSNVRMTPEQEDIFIQHFMPHGVTPRQFQILQQSAKKVVVPPGEAIIKQGEICNHVKLVVSGSTRASISGRRLTAASSIAPKSITEERAGGGNSGAWIGEMNFLEHYHNKIGANNKKKPAKEKAAEGNEKKSSDAEKSDEKEGNNHKVVSGENTSNQHDTDNDSTKDETSKPSQTGNAPKKDSPRETSAAPKTQRKPTRISENHPPPLNRYTIVASDECVIWQWGFDDVEKLMNWSTDFRASLTRAMTAAVVAKVVNFTISKTSQLPTWSTWLDDWRHNAGASVNVKALEDEIVVEEVEEEETHDHGGLDEHGGGI